MPETLTTSPTARATSRLARKLVAVTCPTALGTIISALMRSSPTTRIETTTVAAVSTASSVFSAVTGSPLARAYSSSFVATNRRGASVPTRSRTAALSTPNTTRSEAVVVVIAPNRYEVRLAGVPPGERPMSRTPPAMPP